MEKIEIKMLESMKGRDDDEIQTKLFKKGESYFVGESLAHAFVKQLKIAKEVTTPVEENKAVQVPEDKSVDVDKCLDDLPTTAVVESKEATAKKKRSYKRAKKK